jgi:hypothetical protein
LVPHASAIVKFFTSPKWQAKFADLATQFATHKDNLHFDLQLHISVTVINVSDTLASVHGMVTEMSGMMQMVFEKMQSPEERDWAAFVRQNDGVERVLESEALMKRVIEKQKGGTKDEKGASGKSGQPPKPSITLAEFEKELGKDVESVLAENTKAFEQKFGVIETKLQEVNVTITRQSDRVIKEVLDGMHAGPHERIVDKVFGIAYFGEYLRIDCSLVHVGSVPHMEGDGTHPKHSYWCILTRHGFLEEWKGSVKATHLVIALHDHFTLKAARASYNIAKNPSESQPGERAEAANHTESNNPADAPPDTPAEDIWALEYISMNKIQRLIEVLDDDGSSFVTVNEVNKFTTRRPKGWRRVSGSVVILSF